MDCMDSLVSGYGEYHSTKGSSARIRHGNGFLQLGIELDQQHPHQLWQPALGAKFRCSRAFIGLSFLLYRAVLLFSTQSLRRKQYPIFSTCARPMDIIGIFTIHPL